MDAAICQSSAQTILVFPGLNPAENHHEPGSQRKRPRRAGSDDHRLDPKAGSSYGEGAHRPK